MHTQTKLWSEPEARPKPVGGFSFLSVTQLCMVWWAYQAGHISLYELRVWFACRELTEKRCTLKNGLKGHYGQEELLPLVGGRGGRTLDRAVLSLHKVGLIRWSGPDLCLATSPDELAVDDLLSFWAMLEKVQNNRRPVPVPRRVVRLIAGGARRGVIATVLGHLMRCVYYHKADQGCTSMGAVKASWLCDVFGVDERTVRQARSHLVELGLLEVQPMKAWYMNRYGLRVEVNLQWDRPDRAVDACEANADSTQVKSKTTGSGSLEVAGIPDPELESSLRTPNQEPASSGPPPGSSAPGPVGVQKHTQENQSSLHPDEVLKNRESLVVNNSAGQGGAVGSKSPGLTRDFGSGSPALYINKEPSLKRDHKNQEPASGGRAGVQKQVQEIKTPPSIRHVVFEDLRNTQRLLELHEQAAEKGLVSAGEHGRLRFVAAAEHARSIGSTNPCGLFVWLVKNHKWEYITQDDEDAAQSRIKRHFYGRPRPGPRPRSEQGGGKRPRFQEVKVELSMDARIAVAVKQAAARARFEGDPFHLLRKEKPDWDRNRWERALLEVENARLLQLRARYSLEQVGS